MKHALIALLLCLLLTCACTSVQKVQAQQPASKPPVYSLRFLTVSGTHPRQPLWLVDGGSPNLAYQSLQDAALLQWVSSLPQGSEIDYRSPWAGLPYIAHSSDKYGDSLIPDEKMEGQLKAFGIYCHSKGILFCDSFPVF